MGISCHLITPSDNALISQIAEWYFTEWNISKDRTVQRLTTQVQNDILFHLVLMEDETPVATGGLYHRVGLLMEQPRFKMYDPWVGLVYSATEKRGRGFGIQIMQEIEARTVAMNFKAGYLYTHTAESLYQKMGWETFETTDYHDHTIAVMKKSFKI